MKLDFETLEQANRTRQAEWDKGDKIDLSYRGNELAGEVGEACNVIKKLERERLGIRGSRATKEQLAEEIADVVICAQLIAISAGIDLGASVVAKFNKTSEAVGLTTLLAPIPGVAERDAVVEAAKALEECAVFAELRLPEDAQGDGPLLPSEYAMPLFDLLARVRALREKEGR